jgi:RNA polymerase sigma-70 factor (ECF subfamily)
MTAENKQFKLDGIREKYYVLQVQFRKDPDAFARLYDLYIERIFRFVRFKVSSQEEAEDISSDVFLKAWKFIKESDVKIGNFKAFVYRIARNCVIDFYRNKSRAFERLTDDQEQLETIRDQKNLQEEVANKIEVAAIENHLGKLKEEYREVILLKHVEGFSLSEIAGILEKKSGAVRVLLHRAMKALKDIIDSQS